MVSVFSNGNYANALAPTRSTLWAATSGGVVAWNKATGSYVKFTTLDGLAANRTVAAAVCPLPGLGVIFGSAQGMQIFDTQNGSWKTLNSSNSAMNQDDVSALWCSAEQGLLVVGYTRQGVDLFNARTGEWQYLGAEAGLAIGGMRDIAVLDDGATLWFATQTGLARYRRAGEADSAATLDLFTTENSPLVDNRIESLATDGSGALWLTSSDRLYRANGTEWTEYSGGRGTFPSGRLTGLDVSADGAIWIGSDQTQICRFDPGVEGCVAFYQNEPGMAATPLTSLIVDAEGALYYTTAGGGVSLLRGDTWQQLVIPNEVAPGNSVRQIAEDADGALWLAGNGGVARFTPDRNGSVTLFTPADSGLPSVDVRAVLPTSAGVWVGGSGGAARWQDDTWTTFTPEDGLAGTLVHALTSDAQNRVWLGTATGLSIWTGTAFFNLTSANGLPSEDITALLADGPAVWIGTRGGGLLRFENNQLQLFNRSNSALPGDSVTALGRAPNGALLIGTDQGLARFADNELTPDADLAGVNITAVATAPSGELWAATGEGALRFFNGDTWADAPTAQLPSPLVRTLLFTADGALWIGTDQGGLARYAP